MSQIYNIYCDESSVENVENPYMVIGALFMRRELRDELKKKINEIKIKYSYRGEIKWTKISSRFLPLYKEIIDLFMNYGEDDLEFYCIKVERTKVDYGLYHNNDREEGFYKFYYQLLKNKFRIGCTYYVYLDYKPTKMKNRVYVLEYYLKYKVSKSMNSVIKGVQAQQSSQNVLIQIADFLTGAVNFDNNQTSPDSESKKEVIKYLVEKIKKDNLKFCSYLSDRKFNIFCIEPGRKKDKC